MCRKNKFVVAPNNFKFNNVGHGLFYTGSLIDGRYNFVFDCGSTREQYINEAIDEYIASLKEKKINAVYISHLHKDHFNGLFGLARRAKIEELYLPCLPRDKNIAKAILAYAIFCDDQVEDEDKSNRRDMYNFMLALYKLDDERNDARDIIKKYDIDISRIEIHTNHHGKTQILLGRDGLKDYWCFELYSKKIDVSVVSELSEKLTKLCGDLDTESILDFIGQDKNNSKAISQVFKTILKEDLNETSLMLVHYPINKAVVESKYCHVRNKQKEAVEADLQSNSMCSVTVLTGDAIGFNQYDGFIDSVNEKDIFCLQAPHHGSKDNWDSLADSGFELNKKIRYVFTVKMYDEKHPHIGVIRYLDSLRSVYYCVTQFNTFEYCITAKLSTYQIL